MKMLPNDERTKPGICLLEYGDFGYGKTYSASTLPGKTAYIKTEPRDHKLVLGPFLDRITAFAPESFDDLMETLNGWLNDADAGKLPYNNVFFDSASFFMSGLKIQFEDARMMDRIRDRKTVGDLMTDRYHLVDADVGGIASAMTRLVAAMNKLAVYDINVIWTATVVENPKWNMALSAAPSFLYRAFPSVALGFFDFVGLITRSWELQEDGSVKPPTISFISEDGSYVAKCCSIPLAKKNPAPLDFTRIFKVIKGN